MVDSLFHGMAFSKRLMISGVAGALLTLTLAPFFWFPLLFLSFPLLLLLVDAAQTKKQAFFTGWMFGFGHFVTGLYWISNSLLVDAAQFAWLIPFAVSLIPAILGIYIGLVTLTAHVLRVRPVAIWVVFFAALWVLAEWGRTHFFSGFPWNLTGYSFLVSDYFIQSAYFVKVSGLSFLAVLVGGLPAVVFLQKGGFSAYSMWLVVGVVVAILAGNGVYGYKRLEQVDVAEPKGETLRIRLVQANIEQLAETTGKDRMDALNTHLKMTALPSVIEGFEPELVIWPESGINFFLNSDPDLQAYIGEQLPEGVKVISGTMRVEESAEGDRFYNSLSVLNHDGVMLANYDKQHLVPFGEYVPLQSMLPFLDTIVEGVAGFTAGTAEDTVIEMYGVPAFSPLICYEVIFPNAVVKKQQIEPKWMVNVTNDAWFGDTIGPHQHFHMARMRAVEEGLPMVRVAITGMSGVIDAYGRVIQGPVPYGKSGILDGELILP